MEYVAYGLFIVSVLVFLLSFASLLSGTKRDRRYKTGYKNNVRPEKFSTRFSNMFRMWLYSLAILGAGVIALFISFELERSQYSEKEIELTVTAKKGLHLRNAISLEDNTIITTIPYNEKVIGIQKKDSLNFEWHQINYNGQEGWVVDKYLSK